MSLKIKNGFGDTVGVWNLDQTTTSYFDTPKKEVYTNVEINNPYGLQESLIQQRKLLNETRGMLDISRKTREFMGINSTDAQGDHDRVTDPMAYEINRLREIINLQQKEIEQLRSQVLDL